MALMRLAAIDPGFEEMGVVLFIDGEIVDARTIKTKGNADTDPFSVTVARVEQAKAELRQILTVFSPDVVAIEAYEDFDGKHLRDARRRWTTPLQMGALIEILPLERTHWQKASVVMTQYAGIKAAWKARGAIHPGDHLLKNDHHRSAAAHGLYRINHLRMTERQRP